MNSPYGQALIRGLFGAVVAAGSAFCIAIASTGNDTRAVVAVTAGAFFTYLVQRGYVEGSIDNGSDIQRMADAQKKSPPVIGGGD